MKRKGVDITTLRKQLKLPTTEDPQAKEFREMEKQKEDIFQIVIEQNSQIRDMEIELEKLLKEKEKTTQLAIVPLIIVPISMITTLGASTSTSTPTHTSNSASELVKAMDDLSIQEQEIIKLKSQIKILLEEKLKIDIFYVAEL